MNTKVWFNIFWISGFALIISGTIYKSHNADTGNIIIFVGFGLTVLATVIRLRFLKKSR